MNLQRSFKKEHGSKCLHKYISNSKNIPFLLFPWNYLQKWEKSGIVQEAASTKLRNTFSEGTLTWTGDLVQCQDLKMSFSEFSEVLTSSLSRYSWKPLWRIYQSYGHSLGNQKRWACLSSTKAAATAKPDPKAWKQHYKEIRSQRVDTEAVMASCACKNHLVESDRRQMRKTEELKQHICIFCSHELALCKLGFMCMNFRHCRKKKFLKCLGHISSRLRARSP